MTLAQRVCHLREEGAYVVFGKAQRLERQGRKIIHLEIGQPDFETFSNVAAAGIRAIKNGKTRYTLPAGLLEVARGRGGGCQLPSRLCGASR